VRPRGSYPQTRHQRQPTIDHSKPAESWFHPLHAVEHAADYVYNYDPFRKDLPPKKKGKK